MAAQVEKEEVEAEVVAVVDGDGNEVAEKPAEEPKEAAAAAEEEEEEEEPAVPYADELYRCDTLTKYLKNTYMAKEVVVVEKAAELSGEFASMQLTTKKSNDDHYMSGAIAGGGSKKKGKAGGGTKKGKKIVLDVVTIEFFGDLGMVPPNNEDKVPEAIAALAAKKAYFEGLKPGDVESIATRKAREVAKAERDARRGKGGKGDRGKGGKGDRGKGGKGGGKSERRSGKGGKGKGGGGKGGGKGFVGGGRGGGKGGP